MARKKSIKSLSINFQQTIADVSGFIVVVQRGQMYQYMPWCYDYAIIRLYRAFELLIFNALVGAINNDTKTISETTGIGFPKHLSKEVCEFLISGGRYFDFKGRDGLIKMIKNFVPDNHYLLMTIRDPQYSTGLEQLCAFRNYAAHDSNQSKKAALKAINRRRIKSSGAWLMKGDNFGSIVGCLLGLGRDLENKAPF